MTRFYIAKSQIEISFLLLSTMIWLKLGRSVMLLLCLVMVVIDTNMINMIEVEWPCCPWLMGWCALLYTDSSEIWEPRHEADHTDLTWDATKYRKDQAEPSWD